MTPDGACAYALPSFSSRMVLGVAMRGKNCDGLELHSVLGEQAQDAWFAGKVQIISEHAQWNVPM